MVRLFTVSGSRRCVPTVSVCSSTADKAYKYTSTGFRVIISIVIVVRVASAVKMSKWEDNEEIKLFREYLRIPSVHPNIDYGEKKRNRGSMKNPIG